MNQPMKAAMNLAKKTKDRIIVFESPETETPYVLMGLEEYEKMALGQSEIRGLTEEELLDKINRDIAIWKSEQFFGRENYDSGLAENSENEETFADYLDGGTGKKRRNQWRIPDDRKEAAEEVQDEEEDDDRLYLEDV